MLLAPAYGFLLPAIASIHVHNVTHRFSGALLGTIAGTATVTLGVVASLGDGARPAALFVLGIWWWTTGKLAGETGALPRPFGLLTIVFALVAFAASLAEPFAGGPIWDAAHLLLALWLGVLAAIFLRLRP